MNVPKIRFSEFNNDYEKLKYGDVLKIKSGRDQKKVECKNGKYPILGTGGEIGRTNSFLYNKPSVLIGRKGTINKPQYMETPFWTVDTLFYSEIFDNCHPKYLYYSFQNVNWKKYDESTGVPSLSCSTIEKVDCYIPKKTEQIKVSNFLSLLDKKIELQSKKIEDLKLFKLKIFNELTKNITEFKKIGEIGTLKNGYAFKNNKYDENGVYNILTISNVNGDKYISTSFKNKYSDIPSDIQKHQILKFEDILISLTGNVGRVSYNIGENNLLNQRVGLLELNDSEIKQYIFYIINNVRFENEMINCGQGAAQLNISKYDVENYSVPYPPKEQQIKISKILDCISKKIQLEKNKLDKFSKLKKGLMQNMFV